ncbi:phage tail tape measure protein [Pseudomonas sp. PDM14]|uniref:phage tail tape measure protein n=1 Tax=Pseudomonas sp. PDM14 TaxID=2769288 RepID=UPI001781A8F6|nr:phage tail tape measure protein [Pseudomonas sp. PDM14]MBD9483896.1 phage tail tape measure protein [Pseudomonas sp. PDM14]
MAADKLQLQVVLSMLEKVTGPLRKIQGNSVGAARGLKEARDRLRELNTQQKDVGAWRTQRTAAAQTEQALEAARARVTQLGRDMAATGVPTRQMTRDLKAAIREATNLKRTHSEQQTQLQGLRTKLNAAGISTRNLVAGERELRSKIALTNQTIREQGKRLERITAQTRQLARARSEFDRAQGLAGSMATGGAAGLASGYALARPLQGIVNAFAPAENAATQLKVAMMDKNGQVAADFQRITELANSLGDRLPGTTADFQDMMTMLRRQGISAQSILGGTGEAAAYLGVQLQKPVAEAAEFAAKMQDATRTSEKDMMGLMDTIQRAFYLGVDDNNMLKGFSKISPVMDIIKQSGLEAANTFAPLLVMMDQTGMAGESAGNAFRKVFQGIMDSDGVKEVNKILALQGHKISLEFTDGKGEFGGLENMYAQLSKLKDLNTSTRLSVMKDLFGDDAETQQVLNTMMNKGIDGYREVAEKMQAQADLRKRVNEQLGTLTNTIEAAQGSWTNAMSEIGATIAPELKEIINGLGGVANGIKEWVRANPGLTSIIFKTAAGLALLLTVGGSLAVMLAGMLGPFAMVRYALTLLGIATSATLWPILAVVAAVTALGVVAYLIYKNWDPIKAYFLGLWAEIKAGFDGGLLGILQLITNFSPIGLFYRAFAAVMNYFGFELPGKFTEFGSMLMQGMVNGITSGLAQVKTAITGAADQTVNWFKEKLGIHSPSRVFATLGGFTMAGLTQGLAGGENDVLRQVASTAKRLTNAGAGMLTASNAFTFDKRPPISARGSAPAAAQAPGNITINIHPAPGMDAAAIGREVQRQLAAAQQQQQARGRSRLADQE